MNAGLPRHRFDIWHDPAVFHLLTNAADRHRYLGALDEALKPRSHLSIATFALGGATMCSGLDVVCCSPETLSQSLGDGYNLEETQEDAHQTPGGKSQHLVYCRFKKGDR